MRQGSPPHIKAETRDEAPSAKMPHPCPLEKPRGRAPRAPVPTAGARTKTDTGGRVEHTEAIGGTVVKELGIMAPQLREKGCRWG